MLISGTLGTVQLHDFVVPRHELRCSFTATRDHCLREHETYDDTRRDEVTVHLDKPQVGRNCWAQRLWRSPAAPPGAAGWRAPEGGLYGRRGG